VAAGDDSPASPQSKERELGAMAWAWGPNGKPEEVTAYDRACAGKGGYPSEAAARAGLKFFQDEGALRTNDGMEVYCCTFCREWHFGH